MEQFDYEVIQRTASEYAAATGQSFEAARDELILAALTQVDGGYAGSIDANPEAVAALEGKLGETSEAEYNDPTASSIEQAEVERGGLYTEGGLGERKLVMNALFDNSEVVDSAAIDQYFTVTDHAQDQRAEKRNEELLGLVAFTGGAASVPALIHYGGVVSQVSLHSMQRAGTATQLKLWGASNAARHEGVKLSMLGVERLGAKKLSAGYMKTTGAAGFVVEIFGGIPGTPPAYTPSMAGLAAIPALAPWQIGSAVAAGGRDTLRLFNNVSERRDESN